jgi:hypothetical protein
MLANIAIVLLCAFLFYTLAVMVIVDWLFFTEAIEEFGEWFRKNFRLMKIFDAVTWGAAFYFSLLLAAVAFYHFEDPDLNYHSLRFANWGFVICVVVIPLFVAELVNYLVALAVSVMLIADGCSFLRRALGKKRQSERDY